MWVFTKHGFFSAVCARQGTGKQGQQIDPSRIMIRARARGHLEALKQRFPALLGKCDIQEFAGADYAFRVFVDKQEWSQVLSRLAEETDYDNFKSEVARHQGLAGAAYERSLHEVWSVMHRLQKELKPSAAEKRAARTDGALMTQDSTDDVVRPPAGDGSSIGRERYRLLKAAFEHIQQSIRDGHHLEAITVLESILTDRLGSMVHGALGHKVTLRLTLSGLIKLAKQGPLIFRKDEAKVTATRRYAPLPPDVIDFLTGKLSDWWRMRNNAVHAMAKIHRVGDTTFNERYAKLSETVFEGVRVLVQLDQYDQREKARNGAGRSATWPDALQLAPDVEKRLRTPVEPGP
jgi:hypothetical protein